MDDNCPSNYLVVCPTIKRAFYAYKQLAEYLHRNHIVFRCAFGGMHAFIDLLHTKTMIRFVSEENYEEKVRGMRDFWVVTGHQVETWLDAAEEYEKDEENAQI